jgi:hypothetical protein|tara:strand:- start:3331 stop:3585 length:255 start_codon:yes stop_codon:yes gene_type:complete
MNKAIKKLMLMGSMGLVSVSSVMAAPAIANDTLQGLPQIGTDVGGFLSNLAPGLGTFLIIIGIFTGISAIILAIVVVIRKKVQV